MPAKQTTMLTITLSEAKDRHCEAHDPGRDHQKRRLEEDMCSGPGNGRRPQRLIIHRVRLVNRPNSGPEVPAHGARATPRESPMRSPESTGTMTVRNSRTHQRPS